MSGQFQDKTILVTGGSGSIGSGIVRGLLKLQPRVIRILDNDEYGQFKLQEELREYPNARFLMGDIRDKARLAIAVEGVDLVFHAAALKHVSLCEFSPFEAVNTNVQGTQNILEAAMAAEVEKLITVSTDKAVNPVNVMGATKLLAERLTISANHYKGRRRTVFCCVRFGNVLYSRGSVLPVFHDQIQSGGPVTITDPDMTRFVMSIPEAVDLLLRAAQLARGGEIFVFKMPSVRIGDLADVMIDELAPKYGFKAADIKKVIVGKKEGEKDHEDLLTSDELAKALELDDMFMLPFTGMERSVGNAVTSAYISNETTPLTKDEIRRLLRENSSRSQ